MFGAELTFHWKMEMLRQRGVSPGPPTHQDREQSGTGGGGREGSARLWQKARGCEVPVCMEGVPHWSV